MQSKSNFFMLRKGVTLAEAMVMIIVGGSLLTPILGTMNSSVNRTQSLEHKHQAIAIAQSLQGKVLSSSPYSVPNIPNIVQYTTDGATLTGNVAFSKITEMAALSPSDLIATAARRPYNMYSYKIEVDREALPDGTPQTTLAVLRGIWHLVESYEENLFVSAPVLGQIAAIHQQSHSIKYITPSSKPMHLCVHPNNKFLYAQCATGVSVISIDRGSDYYMQEISFCGLPNPLGDVSSDNMREDVGIDIRPDGKYLFVWNEKIQKVQTLQVSSDGSLLTNAGFDIVPSGAVTFGGTKGTGLRVSTDNILYVVNHDNGGLFQKSVDGPQSTWGDTKAAQTGSYISGKHPIDVREDGAMVLVGEHQSAIDQVNPVTGAVGTPLTGFSYTEGITYSRSSRFAVACDKGSNVNLFYMTNCATQASIFSQNIQNIAGNGYFASVPPNNDNVYWTSNLNKVNYFNIATLTQGLYGNIEPPSIPLKAGFNALGIASRRFPKIYIGLSDGTLHNLAVIDAGAKRILKTLQLTQAPEVLAVNRLGDMVYCGNTGNDKIEKVDIYQQTTNWRQIFNNLFSGADKVRGVNITASDTLFLDGILRHYYATDQGFGAPTGGSNVTTSNSKMASMSCTVAFHHSNGVISSFLPDSGKPGGLRLAFDSSTYYDYPASQSNEMNWPNHPCDAIALSPDDGLLAVLRPDTDPQTVVVYDLSGDWPPKNPTWGNFSAQQFANNQTSGNLGDIPVYPQPWGSFEKAFSTGNIWFTTGIYDTKALRYFAEYRFGSSPGQWRVYAAGDDGVKVAVGKQSLDPNYGFIQEASFNNANYANTTNSSNYPPWSIHPVLDFRTAAFTPSMSEKIWFEWYDRSGEAVFKAGLHRESPSSSDVFFDGSMNLASFGYNLYSKPAGVWKTEITDLPQSAGPGNVKLLFSHSGDWLFILNRYTNRIQADHLFDRTGTFTASKSWNLPAEDTGYTLSDFTLSADGAQLCVTAQNTPSGASGKVYCLYVGDDQAAEFLSQEGPSVQLAGKPISIASPQIYHPRHNCKKIGELPYSLWGASAVNFNGAIYILGGFIDSSHTATTTVLVFDPFTKNVTPSPSIKLAAATGEAGACVLDDIIVIYGGINGGITTYVNKTQRYWPNSGDTTFIDINENYNNIRNGGTRWMPLAGLNGFIYAFFGVYSSSSVENKIGTLGYPSNEVALSGWLPITLSGAPSIGGATAATCGDSIYILGGWNGSSAINTIRKYTPATNSLNTLTSPSSLSQGRCYAVGCQFQGKIYIFGGSTNVDDDADLSSVECYIPGTGCYNITPLPKQISFHCGAAFGGKMYIFGGRDSAGTLLKDIYEYEL